MQYWMKINNVENLPEPKYWSFIKGLELEFQEIDLKKLYQLCLNKSVLLVQEVKEISDDTLNSLKTK